MGNGATELGLSFGKCEEARRRRRAKRLVRAFGQAAADLQQAMYDSHNMIGTCRIKAATIEYKRTRENLLSFMDV